MPKPVTRILPVAVALFVLLAIPSVLSAYARGNGADRRTAGESTAALLGDRAVGGHRSSLLSGQAGAFPLPARRSGVAGLVHVYLAARNTARLIAVGIYSDAGGRPGSLLGEGSGSSLRARAWNVLPITPTALASGKTYWLAVLGRGGTLHYSSPRRCRRDTGVRTHLGEHLRELPKQWSTRWMRAQTHCPISAYVLAADTTLSPGLPAVSDSPPAPSAPSPARAALPPSQESPSALSPLANPQPPEEPTPPAPTNTVPPGISGLAVEGETLKASTGSWTHSPTSYAYRWQDCNALGEGCLSVNGANASSYGLTASDRDSTVRVVVTASNAGGQNEAASAATGTVVPPAPANTVPPAIDGSAVEGETLEADTGMWTENPTSFAYQWLDCDTAGEACSNVTGATAESYKLGSDDVGHELRVVVTASNAGGHNEARSPATSVVSAEESKEGIPKHCFSNPEYEGTARIEACGYPGPHNVGVEVEGEKCSELTSSEGFSTKANGEKIEDKNITGAVVITNNDVTMNHDCVAASGRNGAVRVECGAEGFKIENSDIRGENDTAGADNVALEDDCAWEGNQQLAVAKRDAMWFCSSCVLGNAEVDESYVLANAGIVNSDEEDWHNEDVYINSSDGHGGFAIDDGDTLLNPGAETAIVFGDTHTGAGGEVCSDKLQLTNSFVAGSGAMFQICGGGRATGPGTGEIIVKNDRFARCIKGIEGSPARCKIPTEWRTRAPEAEIFGEEYGYFPDGAANDELLGCAPVCPTGAAFAWEGNYWDNNLEKVTK
jgi:hypothetical protein